MKNHLKSHLLILIIFTALSSSIQAQDRIRQVSCFDSTAKIQSDSIKFALFKQGFIIVKEATMTMESEYEMPVVVPLAQGTWYQIVFIGDITSRLYEVRMFDFNERQVVYLKHFGEGMESNIISYSYIPKFSEYHVIKPVQINKQKKKNICGYIMLFKKIV